MCIAELALRDDVYREASDGCEQSVNVPLRGQTPPQNYVEVCVKPENIGKHDHDQCFAFSIAAPTLWN